MMDKIKFNSTLAYALYIFGALGTISGGIKGYSYIKEITREKIREQVAVEIDKIDSAHANIQRFKDTYKEFLDRSMRYRPVGIYRDEKDGSVKYRHIDGELYQPVWWADKRDYYFRRKDGDWEMCH